MLPSTWIQRSEKNRNSLNKQRKYNVIACIVIAGIILLDQLLKVWVKTHMALGENIPLLGHWFNLYFVENEGMAFGISLGQNFGKLMLSLLRIVLVVLMCWYTHRLIKRERMDGLTLAVFCLVIAGALGNIIDSLFYGLAFSESGLMVVATLFPEGGGYAPFFYGRVVDMFYLKLFPLPDWFPVWGGSYFFPAIFNIADACITVGIFLMIVFNKRIFRQLEPEKKESEEIAPEGDPLA